MGANELRDKLIREGKLEGIKKGKITTAKNLLKMGYSIKEISKATELDIEEIKTLKENI